MARVVGKEYFELVREFPLLPIRSEREMDRATAVIDGLIAKKKEAQMRTTI